MDENKLNIKRRAGIFAAVIILADSFIRTGGNMLVSYFTSMSADTANSDTFTHLSSICLSVFSLVIIFLGSYIFTKDKRKTVILAGSIYFGKEAAGLVHSLISTVADILTSTTLINPNVSSVIVTVGNILTLPLVIALACFAFTAFEGINKKLDSKSLGSSGMLLSKAKNRYLTAYIVVMIISTVMTSSSSFVFAYLTSYGIIDFDGNIMIFSVAAQLINWLSTVIGFTVFYCVGYKPFRSRIDGMVFISISGLAGAVSSIFTSLAALPLNIILNSTGIRENLALSGILSAVATAAGIIALIAYIFAAIYFLKYFFPKSEISLFTDNTPENGIGGEMPSEIES